MKKWILRLLVAITVMLVMAIAAMNIVSGTGEPQKKGLESAFSNFLGGETHFTTLNTFNIFPDLIVDIGGLSTSVSPTQNLSADKLNITFGAYDLFMKTRKIKNLSIKDARIDKDIFLPFDLYIKTAATTKDGFVFSGTYNGQDLQGKISMTSTGGVVPNYGFAAENPFTINIGSVQISGQFSPYAAEGTIVKSLSIFAATKTSKENCNIDAAKTIPTGVFFKETLADFVTVTTADGFKSACSKTQK